MAEIIVGFRWHERSWRTLWIKKEQIAWVTTPEVPEGEWVTVTAKLLACEGGGVVDYIGAEMERHQQPEANTGVDESVVWV